MSGPWTPSCLQQLQGFLKYVLFTKLHLWLTLTVCTSVDKMSFAYNSIDGGAMTPSCLQQLQGFLKHLLFTKLYLWATLPVCTFVYKISIISYSVGEGGPPLLYCSSRDSFTGILSDFRVKRTRSRIATQLDQRMRCRCDDDVIQLANQNPPLCYSLRHKLCQNKNGIGICKQ